MRSRLRLTPHQTLRATLIWTLLQAVGAISVVCWALSDAPTSWAKSAAFEPGFMNYPKAYEVVKTPGGEVLFLSFPYIRPGEEDRANETHEVPMTWFVRPDGELLETGSIRFTAELPNLSSWSNWSEKPTSAWSFDPGDRSETIRQGLSPREVFNRLPRWNAERDVDGWAVPKNFPDNSHIIPARISFMTSIALALLLLPVALDALLSLRRQARIAKGVCSRCMYPRSLPSAVCTECGVSQALLVQLYWAMPRTLRMTFGRGLKG